MASSGHDSDSSGGDEKYRSIHRDPTAAMEIERLQKELRREATARLEAEFKLVALEEEDQKVRPTHKELLPEKYDGTGSVRAFLKHFEACARVNGWDRRTARQWLEARLVGPATRILDESYDGYVELKDLLLSTYGPSDGADNYALELRGRRRKVGESLKDLAQAIKDLVGLAYPELDPMAKDRFARDAFKEAIEDTELRQAIFRAKPESLEESVQAAVEAEVFHRNEKQRKKSYVRELAVLEAKVENLMKVVAEKEPAATAHPPSVVSPPVQQPPAFSSLACANQPPWQPSPDSYCGWYTSFQPRWPPQVPTRSQQPMSQTQRSNWRSSVMHQQDLPPPPEEWISAPQSLKSHPPNVVESSMDTKCWFCGGIGHIRRQCPKWHDLGRPKQENFNWPTRRPQGRPQGLGRGRYPSQ